MTRVQRVFRVLAIILFMPPAGASAAGPDCAAIDGLTGLLTPGTVAVFGEIHGTAEAPAFIAEVTCGALAAGRSVLFGLEMPGGEEKAVLSFLASGRDAEARAALLAREFWHRPYQDGRASEAMLDLLIRLGEMRAAGLPLAVALFDVTERVESSQARDRAMAGHLHQAITSSEADVTIVLTGNVHARITPGVPWDDAYQPMAYLAAGKLPERRWIALDLGSTGGSAWNCRGSEVSDCKEYPTGGRYEGTAGGIVLRESLGDEPFHGYYHVGSISASPPAAGASVMD